jgi:hypothetical protein
MRVHLSPWEIAQTSLNVADAKKQRRESWGSSPSLGVSARFVSHRRSAKKAVSDNILPSVIMTGGNRISVMGTNSNDSLRESKVLQYSSRKPFLEGESPIPAIYDSKQERIYALQTENTRLLSWPASSGPDEAQAVSFEHPVQELAVFRQPTTGKTLLYGTCSDGRLFFVNDGMKVGYISPKSRSGRVVATLARDACGVGTKRKSSRESDDIDCLMIYQILAEDNGGIVVLCHDIKLELRDTVQAHIVKTESSAIHLDKFIENVEVVGLCEDTNQIGLFYSIGDKKRRRLFTMISLEKGTLIGVPIELPEDTLCGGLVGSTLLAVGTSTNVVVLDMIRGARIHQQALPDYNSDYGYSLVTDGRRARLSIVFAQDKTICVAAATGKFHTKLSSSKEGSLASSLAASLETTPSVLQLRQFVRSTAALTFDEENGCGKKKCSCDGVESSVAAMLRTYNMIIESTPEASNPSFLLKAYENALRLTTNGTSAHNPQDAVPSTSRSPAGKNGVHHSPKKKIKLVNGILAHATAIQENGKESQTKGVVDSEAPSVLVDCVATIAVQLLCISPGTAPGTVRSDAGYLLKRLLRSRKVLARSHLLPDAGDSDSFSKLFRALQSTELNGASIYRPVEFAMDIFSFCPDASEKQMVASLQFVLRRASPDDIAEYFASVSNKHFNSLSERFMSLQAKGSLENGEKESSSLLSTQLLKSGATLLLRRILSYSSCNDSLLRGALSDGLSRQEKGLLARMLVGALADPAGDKETNSDLHSTVSLRAIQWLSALCDCLLDEPADSKTLNIFLLRRWIAAEVSKTEAILSLKETLFGDSGVQQSQSESSSRTVPTETPVPSKMKVAGQMPPYQIEWLLF